MRRKPIWRSAFFDPRALLGFALCFLGVMFAVLAIDLPADQLAQGRGSSGRPQELVAGRARRSFDGDLRRLPYIPVAKRERPEREPPPLTPRLYQPAGGTSTTTAASSGAATSSSMVNAPAPGPTASFDGLDFANWGDGHPPDENGDVGPTYYVQVVNTSIGIFDKATGNRVGAFTFDTFMSQGQFGNLCDTDNFGDPVVLYDTFEDRWIITDFAFKVDGSGSVANPPGAFQCIAVSKSGDPVNGGWNYYSINTTGGLGDYPKFGVWTDGIYMSANMFDYAASGGYQNSRVYAFNKAQMYAGAPTVQVVQFDAPSLDFTLLPADARLQTGTPPPGAPNYFISTWEYLNALTVYKFHVDWDHISLSTFTGPDIPSTGSSRINQSVPKAATPANTLDTLGIRAMARNQYTNLGGAESLWTTHTVRRASNGFATPRWYQMNVTGGTVAASTLQTATWDPDGANIMYRYVPSLAIDRAGNMAIGYSTSNLTTSPGIGYAGRLATDPVNTFSQAEQVLFQGTGSQSGSCGGSCTRWGDYTSMTLDPSDGCTFWYTNEYYTVNGLNDQTRIGAFKYSQCTAIGSGGTLSGQVTDSGTGAQISGATVKLGAGRSTTTDENGNYSFTPLPAGVYPSVTATAAGYDPDTVTSLVVSDNATTTQNFGLTAAATSGCITDTTRSDFQGGVPTDVDLNSSPGDLLLPNRTIIDQQQLDNSGFGISFNTNNWTGQTFVPSVSGQLIRLELKLFCSNCFGSNPAVQVEIGTASGGLPAGPILAATTIPGFSNGGAAFYTATFASPPTLAAGTQYAYTLHTNTARTGGTYAAILSSNSSAYANGDRVQSTNVGASWDIAVTNGSTSDLSFKTYIQSGYAASGIFVSSAKDANPSPTGSPEWGTLSWGGSVPANTTLNFQAAANNDLSGTFNFVGPDGTANSFFNNGDPLSQFNGLRYLKYEAFLNTSDSSVTPTVSEVTVCFSDVGPPSTPTPAPTPSPTPTPTPTPTPIPTIQVTVQTNPAGLSVTVDSTSYNAPQTFSWIPGSSHTITTSSPQNGDPGVRYVWSKWSDGGAISHTIAPTTNKTYTATFTKQYYLTMTHGTGGTVSPSSGWKNSGAAVSISATPTNNTLVSYNFTSWAGNGAGSYSGTNNPASITMGGPITETAAFTQNPIQVTIQTNPAGRAFTVDGTPYTAAQSFSWQPGSSHTIATISPQNGDPGVRYVWSNWSDGGAVSHTVTPTTNKIYTAKFTTQYFLTMVASTGGKVSPASAWKNSGAAISISATPATGYSFTNWSGTGTGSYSGTTNPDSVTMGGPVTETATFTQN